MEPPKPDLVRVLLHPPRNGIGWLSIAAATPGRYPIEERTPPPAESGGSPLLSSAATMGVALPVGVPVPPPSSRQPSGWSGATVSAVAAVGPAASVLGPNQKLVHLVRHAQGFHNVSELKAHLRPHDARLTPAGEEQCAALRAATTALRPELIVASPLTRALQTATLCFGPQLTQLEASGVPLVALEDIRETCNYACDGRRPISQIAAEFPRVDFGGCPDDEDSLWARYEAQYGNQMSYGKHRESAHLHSISLRSRRAFSWLGARPEKEIVLVSHCSFLHTILGTIDGRDGRPPALFDCGEDHDLATWLAASFRNCEMRSVLLTFPE